MTNEPNDFRIKLWFFRNHKIIPTDAELQQIPIHFRRDSFNTPLDSLNAGIELEKWIERRRLTATLKLNKKD